MTFTFQGMSNGKVVATEPCELHYEDARRHAAKLLARWPAVEEIRFFTTPDEPYTEVRD